MVYPLNRKVTDIIFYCKSVVCTPFYLSRNTMQVGNVRHYACGHILQKIHFHFYVACYPLMSTLCVLGHTLSLYGNWIWFLNIYGYDWRDELQEVCWEQRIWGVFRKAPRTIAIRCVSINHFKKQNRPVSGTRISEIFGCSFFLSVRGTGH